MQKCIPRLKNASSVSRVLLSDKPTDDHLSLLPVTEKLHFRVPPNFPLSCGRANRNIRKHGVASSRVYSAAMLP